MSFKDGTFWRGLGNFSQEGVFFKSRSVVVLVNYIHHNIHRLLSISWTICHCMCLKLQTKTRVLWYRTCKNKQCMLSFHNTRTVCMQVADFIPSHNMNEIIASHHSCFTSIWLLPNYYYFIFNFKVSFWVCH